MAHASADEWAAVTDVAALRLTMLVDEGLGNTCYLLDLGDGSALVVDPPRDLRAVRRAAASQGLKIRLVADTHLHADFLSGATQLAHDDGAQIVASAAGRREFTHRGLNDGDDIDLGGLRLQALLTPGHTDEHLSFLLLEDGPPLGVFSGGSLIVGSAARTDLLGPERAEELARAQYASLQRLAALPEPTALWPTHGAGSFCAAPPGAERTSTIGAEKAHNSLLALADEDLFVAALLGSLGSYPDYFLRLGEINRRGPAVLDASGSGRLDGLGADRVRDLQEAGCLLVDVRPVADFAAGHVPDALSIPLRAQFASWLGWLLPPESPIVLVRNQDQAVEEIVWKALNIGYDRIVGELAGGMAAWTAAGLLSATLDLLSPDQLVGRRLVDVRQATEFAHGHVPGAHNIELGALARATDRLPREPTVLMCGHGERATTAASLLERAGHRDLAVLIGGADDWARSTGRELDIEP